MRIVFSLLRSTNETHFLLLFIYRTNKTTSRQWNGTSTNRFGGTFIMLDFPLLFFHGNVNRIVCVFLLFVLFLFDRKWRHEANKLIRKLEPGIFVFAHCVPPWHELVCSTIIFNKSMLIKIDDQFGIIFWFASQLKLKALDLQLKPHLISFSTNLRSQRIKCLIGSFKFKQTNRCCDWQHEIFSPFIIWAIRSQRVMDVVRQYNRSS